MNLIAAIPSGLSTSYSSEAGSLASPSFLIFLAVLLLIFLIAFYIAGIPGRIASKRRHPATDAIRICGYFGLFFGGIFWLVAFIWAHTVPMKRSAR